MKNIKVFAFVTLLSICLTSCGEEDVVLKIAPENDITSCNIGDLVQFSATVNGEEVEANNFAWRVDNDKIAEIDRNGVFRAKQKGEALVTAIVPTDIATTATYTITITDPSGGTGTDTYYKPTSYTMNASQFKAHWGPTEQMLGSTGQQKVLVVPTKLSDGPAWTSSMLDEVEKAFFGKASDTGWQSVSSYYEQSSFGQLKITGEVTSVLNVSQSTATARNVGDSFPEDYVAPAFYSSASQSLLKEYDQDGNGYVDAVCFIYSNNIGNNDVFWAWVWNCEVDSNTTKPQVSNYMWASYQFLNEGYGTGGIDAHTFIHEFGHILGLDDYYSNLTYQPAGGWLMMDNNVLDHDVYSKMLKGWTYPYVVDNINESVTITLTPSNVSGDCILVKNNWNGSPIDEYLLIELYTPEGLNKQDATNGYINGFRNAFNIPGVKIYHIDSRGVQVDSRGTFQKYITNSSQISSGSYGIGASNLGTEFSLLSSTYASTYKLIHLLEATGTNTFKSGKSATNNTLFQAGDSFQASSTFFPNGTKFNDGSSVGYNINIDQLSSSSATITISKI